ncbi:MAG TPA: ABC transporter permease [Candidatus Sulfopaludibacter sp.]|jgi:predicted permease|nr:ABC transporter permease [Candidatus Sulfopaludibacter sp.]
MWKELAYSIRTLRRSPLFTAAAVLSLALGIGANTAIFSLLDQVVLKSLPVQDPDRLVVLHSEYSAPGSSSSDNNESVFSAPMYRDLRDHNPAFTGIIARMGGSARLSTPGGVTSATVEMVSGNFFQVLGVPTTMGRVFTPQDDAAAGGSPVVILSHAYWSSQFGNNPSILNQNISLNGLPFQVIGVAGAKFRGITPGHIPNLYVPIAMEHTIVPTMDALQDRQTRWLNLFGRVKPGASLRQTQAAFDVAYHSMVAAELPQLGSLRTEKARQDFLNQRAELRPAAQGISGMREEWEKPLAALMTLVALVLLIACANVASLLLARATGRQKEIAIRLAMGAGRGMLVRQLLLEGLLLAAGGGLLGLAFAYWSVLTLVRVLPKSYAGELTATLDPQLLLFTLAVSVVCGLLFSIVPALQATRPDLAGTLKQQATNVAGGSARFRRGLVVAQLALSLLLVVGAGVFSGSLSNLLHVNLGFHSQRLLIFNVNATLDRPKLADAVAFYKDLQDRLAALPGVSGVGAAASGPFGDGRTAGNITVEGYTARPDEYTGASTVAVNAGFFQALGIPLRAGREFTERDDHVAPKTVVVNETFVKKYLAGQNPIGRRLMFGGSNHPVFDREIVGVVPDIHSEVRTPATETIFMPYQQWTRPERLVFYVRSAGDESRLSAGIRQAVREADPNIPVMTIQPLDLKIRDSLYTERLIALLSQAFGVLATLLAAIGLYGVVAYAVARRTAEIGIRLALGAVPANVIGMILRDAGSMAAAGIALGLGGSLLLSKLVDSQLFGIKAADPLVLGGAAAVLALVTLLAAIVPGWRASRIDPMRALKYE